MFRYLMLVFSVSLQTALGGLYAWSVFVPHLVSDFGMSAALSAFVFGLMIAVFTLATIPAGRMLLRFGPAKTACTGAVLFSLGYLIASFARDSSILIILGLGLCSGTGIGFAYVCPLSVCMQWFPSRKGLVSGIAVAGFGLGAVFLSTLAQYLLTRYSLVESFRLLSLFFAIVTVPSAVLLRYPVHPGEKDDYQKVQNTRLMQKVRKTGSSRQAAGPFFMLSAFSMFSCTFAGLLVSGNLVPIKLGFGLDAALAVGSVSLFALGNAAGRIIWGQLHDYYKSRKIILASLLSLSGSMLLLLAASLLIPPGSRGPAFLSWLALPVGFGFGASFVVYAAALVDRFGGESLARLYPFVFLFYGLAALIGPPLGGFIVDTTGSYMPAFMVAVLLLSVAVLLNYRFLEKKY